ncbi:hypothetical protein Pcinc_014032 [Petrolisthes cinctipes]|uniref:Uncharacterized protein n=1 Tax=Petrolisthes cinctipes TaxID=88211 RepID=A0AAE1FXU3_PETCI|nr:hypothetical protein Pcinc_014032 [Petrolisthes cinctipes]
MQGAQEWEEPRILKWPLIDASSWCLGRREWTVVAPGVTLYLGQDGTSEGDRTGITVARSAELHCREEHVTRHNKRS